MTQAAPATMPVGRAGPTTAARLWSSLESIAARLFVAVLAYALYVGWRTRGEQHLSAETGLGYWLGIAGGALMLLLFLYPLRKRLRWMRRWGRFKYWFRAHMILGILGPTLVVFHANFKLGSLNSAVALVSMLVVATSGLVGRYFYAKIHYGLYGGRATLRTLREDAEAVQRMAGVDLAEVPQAAGRLAEFERRAVPEEGGLARTGWRLLVLRARTRRFRSGLLRDMGTALDRAAAEGRLDGADRRARRKAARRYVSLYLGSVRRVAELTFYERLFGLWHVLHVPLFALMALAAVVHVVAVHLY